MKVRKLIPALTAVLLVCSPVWAQQSQSGAQQQLGGAATPVQPISTQANAAPAPAARGLFVSYDPENGNAATQTQPDDSPLTGVETFSLGVLRSFTTLFDPSVFVTESADNGLTQGRWDTGTSVGGGLALLRDWNHARISAQYFGAQSYYPSNTQFDGSYHDLSLAQATRFGRWGLLVRDDVLYSRTSDFAGFPSGGTAPASGAASGSTLQPGLAPSQSIVTGQVGSLNNTALAQVTYDLSHRATLTFMGAYGLLHFSGPGYIDSHTVNGSVGYNYALSRLNSFATSYSFAQDNFNGSVSRATTHTVQAFFGRKITGRLAMQLGAGPQIEISQNSFGFQSAAQLAWAASGALTYGPRPKRVSYVLAYSHGLTSGSGVFFGAESDNVTGTVQAGFGRDWFASMDAGFASNRSITGASGASASRFNTWFSGVNINRPLGRHLVFSASYQYQSQDANGACPVVSCGIASGRQAIFSRLQWHPWPARIQ